MGEFNVNKTTGDLEQTAGADNEAKANRIDIAPDFDDTTAYAKGDLCYHEGTLYEFNQAHAAGAWNSAEVDAVDVSDVISHINDTIEVKSVTADGVKTYSQILNEFYGASKEGDSLTISSTAYRRSGSGMFSTVFVDSSSLNIYIRVALIKSSGSKLLTGRIKTDSTVIYTDMSAEVPSNGMKIILKHYH